MKRKSKESQPNNLTFKNLVLFGKTDDDKIRQFILTPDEMKFILNLLIQTSNDNLIHILKEPIDFISWEDTVDIRNTK